MKKLGKEKSCLKKLAVGQALDISIFRDVNLKTSKPCQGSSGCQIDMDKHHVTERRAGSRNQPQQLPV
jgi:hypothetical protein